MNSTLEAELPPREVRPGDARLADLDPHHLGALSAELERVEPLVGTQVEHAQLAEGLGDHVGDRLHEPLEAVRRARLEAWAERLPPSPSRTLWCVHGP
jgi:hypothetical protein